MICARKINDEKNIFEGSFSNPMFVTIWITITVVQFILTQFTSDIFKVSRSGLSSGQWILCLILAFSVWPINLIIKFMPDTTAFELKKKSMALDEPNLIHKLRGDKVKRSQTLTKQLTKRFDKLASYKK